MSTISSLKNQPSILCIEPTGEICVLLGMMLHRKELTVRHAVNIDEAVKMLMLEQPVLIVIENNFAQNEIATKISGIKNKAPRSKILMVSSVADEAATTAISAGVDRYLLKPFNKAVLLNAVSSLLR